MNTVSAFAENDPLPKRQPTIEESPGSTTGGIDASCNYADNVVMGARQGHGFAAEKMNHLHDVMTGKDARLVGGDNAKNGADRIVDGIQIQTKYCASGQKCIDACFENGTFKYLDSAKNPMQIEVPRDMHEAAIKAMETRIKNGEIPNVTDPEMAKEIVRKGHYTYEQAANVARAGTIESLTFDAVNGLKLAGTAMGISAAITFATAIWDGKDWKSALDTACFEGLSVGGIAWVGSILTAQLGRTGIEQGLRGATDFVVDVLGSKVSAAIANTLREGGKSIYGGAAKNYLSKVLRGNVVTGIVTTAILSTDDFIDLFSDKASKAQIFKNIAKTGVGVGGGTAGWIGGAAAGAALGSAVPIIGTAIGSVVGGIIGGVAAGGAAGKAASVVLDQFIEDDAQRMLRVVEEVFAQLAVDNLLSKDEGVKVIKEFQKLDVIYILRGMHESVDRPDYAKTILLPLVRECVHARKTVVLPSDEQVMQAAAAILKTAIDEQDVVLNESFGSCADNTEGSSTVEDASPAPTKKETRLLSQILAEYESHINDGSSFFVSWDLGQAKGLKKMYKAQDAYIYNDKISDPSGKRLPSGGAIALVDTTALRSAKDGLYLTEYELYFKPSYEPRFSINIRDIETIRVYEEEASLVINGNYVKYLHKGMTSRMKVIVKCINKYLDQFRTPDDR